MPIAILAVAVIFSLFAYRAHSSRSHAATDASADDGIDRHLEGESVTQGEAAGVRPRSYDPMRSQTGWKLDDLDPRLLADVLDQPVSAMDVALRDLQANADLVPWLDSLVGDDEFGRAVAECRSEHEPAQTSRCHWEQDVVLRRSSQGESSVVAVRPRLDPTQHPIEPGTPFAPKCKEWARCVATAWKGRPGKFPHGADDLVTTTDDGSELIALRTSVHHLEAYGKSASEYQATYRDRIEHLEEKVLLREQAYAKAEDDGTRSREALEGMYYNLLLEQAQLVDSHAYLRYLNTGGS